MESPDENQDLDTGVKGKQAELIVIGKLLERAYKVYTPLVDTGIDCLVDVGGGQYKEIQIKYREDTPNFSARAFKPRDNFYLICYLSTRRGDDFWIIPSRVFFEEGATTKVRNRDRIQLRIGREGSDAYDKFIEYHDNFGILLAGATREVRKVVQQASMRITGPHLKQAEYEKEALKILSAERRPLERKEIVRRIYENLHSKFSEADKEISKKTGMTRWEKTCRWAITNLKNKGLVESRSKNQWSITLAGRDHVAKLG